MLTICSLLAVRIHYDFNYGFFWLVRWHWTLFCYVISSIKRFTTDPEGSKKSDFLHGASMLLDFFGK